MLSRKKPDAHRHRQKKGPRLRNQSFESLKIVGIDQKKSNAHRHRQKKGLRLRDQSFESLKIVGIDQKKSNAYGHHQKKGPTSTKSKQLITLKIPSN